jgi:hypothetical protein
LYWADEDGIVHLRNSERGTLNKCPQRWWWSWREGLRPKETQQALWFGTGIHLALAHYYQPGKKRGKDMIDLWREYAEGEAESVRVSMGGIDEDKYVDARDLGETMLSGYMKRYNGDKHWDVVGTEQTFEVRIPWLSKKEAMSYGLHRAPFETRYFILNGTFDGVYYDTKEKRFKLMEHKTAGTIWTPYVMDNQTGTYWMVAGTVGHDQGWLPKGQQIKEITYNFLRKSLPDERPRDDKGYYTNKPTKGHYIEALRVAGVDYPTTSTGTPKGTTEVFAALCDEAGLVVLGDRSKRQPPPLFDRKPIHMTARHKKMQLLRLRQEATRMATMVHGRADVTKSSGRDTCPMCPYREMCELHESGADWQGYRDAMYRTEDVYADHRKSA